MVDSWLARIEALDAEIQQEYDRLYVLMDNTGKYNASHEIIQNLSEAMDDLWGAAEKLEKFKQNKEKNDNGNETIGR